MKIKNIRIIPENRIESYLAPDLKKFGKIQVIIDIEDNKKRSLKK